MTNPTRYAIEPPPGFRSREAARFVAQLDDLGRRLHADTRALDAAALAWQPAPGLNTIGMLLAHVAYWEVFWTRMILEDRVPPFAVDDVLMIEPAAIGMPLGAEGAAPAALAGRELAFYDDLLARARAHTTAVARRLGDTDLEREVIRRRPDGSENAITVRWTLHHLVEHLAGHHGQVNLLRHLHRRG